MQRPSRTILIVDDSPEDRELYRRYLQRDPDYSYTILEASLGRQGLELWQQQQPDLVLLDYRLPDLDGLELLAQLPSSTPQSCFPVVVITGQGNEAIAVQAMKAGAQDYLVKEQITPEGLHLSIHGAIETVQIRTELQQRIERERVVAQITQQIYQSLDLDHILQTTVTEVRQFLNTDRVLVFQLHLDGNGTVVAESVGSAWRSLLSSTIYDPCLAENYLRFSRPGSITYDSEFVEDYVKRYRQGQVTAIPDIYASNIDPCHIELLAQFQVNANLVVPILHDDRFWGLLIAHHCAAPRFWQPLEIDLLKELAAQMGIALRQAELYQQSQSELAERNRVEAELRESEERLRSALEASRMGTWDWNIETGQVQWSNNMEAMFGLEPEAFDGSFQMFSERLHPVDRDRVLATINQAIATGEDYNIEFRVVYPNGTIRWALSQGKVFYDRNGHPVRMAGNDIDITKRKQAEIALRESEQRYAALLQVSPVGIFRTDVHGDCLYTNARWCELTGLSPEEAQGQGWVRALHPDDRDHVFVEWYRAAELNLPFLSEYRFQDPDGNVSWVIGQAIAERDVEGRLIGYIGTVTDISDRKRSEQALRESEERFRTSVENMLDCFAIYEAIRNEQGEIIDFRTKYVNDAACLNNQMTREQQIGRGLCELLPGHRGSGLFDEYCQVVETGQSLVKDSLVYEDDYGQQRLIKAFDIRIAKFGDGYIATWRDITERKQTEETLRQNEQLLRLALAGAQAGSWDWEIATGNVVWSPENYVLYGVDPATTSASYEIWYHILHPDDREATKAEVMEVIKQRLPEFRSEFRIIHPQLGLRWILGLGQLTLDDQGNPLRLSGINLDTTDRKLAEDALRQSEAFNRRILESSSDCIKLLDLDGHLLYMNPGGLCLLEIDDIRPYLNVNWVSLWQEETCSMVEAAIGTAQAGELTRFQGFCPTAKGTPKWWDVVVTPIFNAEGQVIQLLATSRDITDRKQSEMERDRLLEQEQSARESAERANRIKDEFLAVLSHELRSPLNPILGWAKLMQSRKFDATKTNEALATIERNAKLQTQLIDDLLDIAKILRGKFVMNAAPVDLAFVIEAALDTVRTAAVAKAITLHAVLPQIGRVSGDSARLQQIVWNLLSNAIKFTPAKGQVEVRLERDGDQAKIIVNDTGKGIHPDFLPHIFESFRQEDASTTRQYGGLGLGLAIVRHLVEVHGGIIWADSPGEGQGATFTIQFPLLDTELEPPQSEAVSVDELDLTGVRILSVDDEPDTRNLLVVSLTQYGAEVLAVASAAEVLANLESFQPDVLISDIGMPEVDGYMLMRQIRALPSEKGGQIRAIALTAYAREEDYQQAINNGYQRHLTKPLDLDQLVQAVIELARHTRFGRAREDHTKKS
ncbi:PAS domain-containing protein [Oculatella sp. LEGE 06141]|uniref:PAS domain-containing protein n=1 Tax=Oculatella sp. LEGE 06141 TaxID=1828648 RepID=UPI0018821986|nr:PAS domain-containing protein [Oculatella sp. LEGE 06141]MBE9182624.1 PAS domain-containing protein [Oculatella sp. LEGE 06141]